MEKISYQNKDKKFDLFLKIRTSKEPYLLPQNDLNGLI